MHTSIWNSEGRNDGSVQININYSNYNNEWLNILNNKINVKNKQIISYVIFKILSMKIIRKRILLLLLLLFEKSKMKYRQKNKIKYLNLKHSNFKLFSLKNNSLVAPAPPPSAWVRIISNRHNLVVHNFIIQWNVLGGSNFLKFF